MHTEFIVMCRTGEPDLCSTTAPLPLYHIYGSFQTISCLHLIWVAGQAEAPAVLDLQSAPRERAAVSAYMQRCSQALADLPTTWQEDLALLNPRAAAPGIMDPESCSSPSDSGGSPRLSVRHEAAIRARLEHKHLLLSALDVLGTYDTWLSHQCRMD